MSEVLRGLWQTIYMMSFSTIIALGLGFPLAVLLIFARPGGLKPNAPLYRTTNAVINVIRSVPFIILMIILFPLAAILIGKRTGPTAAIISLSIAAAPFVARIIEQSLLEVEPGLIEAAKAMGADAKQILFRVMIPEATPSLIMGVTTSIINILGYTAMAGAIGGGGLGDVAIRFGLYKLNSSPWYLWGSVLLIILLVQLVQWAGNVLARRKNHA